MGTNTLLTATDGTPIPPSEHNGIKEALGVDLVPRNVSGVPTDVAGGLGTTVFRWATSYINKLFIGAVASGISFEDSSGDLVIKVNSVEVKRFIPGGINKVESSLSEDFNTTSPTYVDVTNLSVTITTSGRPVFIGINATDNSPGEGSTYSIFILSSTNTAIVSATILRDSTNIGYFPLTWGGPTAFSSGTPIKIPATSISIIDTPSAGTYTYKVQLLSSSTDYRAIIENVKLFAYEL